MVAIDKQIDPFQEKPSFLQSFVKAVGKCNQVIYEEAIVEPCCPPDRDVFDDNSMYSYSTASETPRDDIETREIIIDMTSVGAILGHANGALSPVNDDSPRELTKAQRSRSVRRFTRSASPKKRSKSFGRSSAMGRGRRKEITSPMRSSRTKSPRRRALSPQRRSASTPRKSRTPKREGSGKKKSQAASPATSHREEPPVTSMATRASSALRGRAGGKSSKNKSKETKDKNKPTRAVLVEAHPLTRKQPRRHKSSRSIASKGEKVLEAHLPMDANAMTCEYEVLNEKSEIAKIEESPSNSSIFFFSCLGDADERRGLAMI